MRRGISPLVVLALAACGSSALDGTRAAPAMSVAAGEPRFGDGGAACEVGDESVQRRTTECLCCHREEFGVAGSVDPLGPPVARLEVVDANGVVAVMAPNAFANFFRHYP